MPIINVLQFLLTFLACTYISIVSAQTPDFPTCAVRCARAAAVVVKCSFSNTACLCSQEPDFSRTTLRCSQRACNTASMKQLESALPAMCSATSTTTTSTPTTSASKTPDPTTPSAVQTSTTTTLTAPTTSDSSTSFSSTSTTVVVETVVVEPTTLASSGIKPSPFLMVFNLSWAAFFTGCYILIGGLTD